MNATHKRMLRFTAIYLVLLIVVYALSIGPSYRAATAGHLSGGFFRATYWPLIYLGQETPLGRPLQFWLELWVPHRSITE